jgi:uncharacterized protein YdeI (BOF family)
MKALTYFGSAILVIGLAATTALAQTQTQPQDPAQSPTQTQPAQPQAAPNSADSMPQSQAFTGTVIKSSDGYMLQDDTNKSSYKLDDAKQARKFSGKNVKVTGTLDSTNNMIHVTNVQLSSTY